MYIIHVCTYIHIYISFLISAINNRREIKEQERAGNSEGGGSRCGADEKQPGTSCV